MLTIKKLLCEYQKNPLAIEAIKPVFTWSFKTSKEKSIQKNVHLLVASNPDLLSRNIGDLWDTSILPFGRNRIRYDGFALEAGKSYWWKIRVQDESMRWSGWEQASFTMAISSSQWRASWISPSRVEPNQLPDVPDPSPLLRKSFVSSDPIIEARLYICGLGYYRAYLNGERIGEYALAPEVAQYDKSTYYDCYNVTGLIQQENVLAVELGNGWYNSFTNDVWGFQNAPWRHFPKLLCQLVMRDVKGQYEYVCSDTSWRFHDGPIVFDGIRNGEFYDARKEIPTWNKIGFDDSDWGQVNVTRPPGGVLKASQIPQIKIKERIIPKSCFFIQGKWVFDMGENISGFVELNLRNLEEGQTITLRYGEKLSSEGLLDTSDIDYLIYSGRFQTDQYTARGGGNENWAPRFTYHGFRYVEMSGYEEKIQCSQVIGIKIHTDLAARGLLTTSNRIFNSIHTMCVQSLLVNYHSIPTDCPHREKNGWTGDAHLSSEQGLFNLDSVTAYRKYLYDIIDCQRPNGAIPGIVPTPNWGYNWGSGPAWDSALPILAWNLYVFDGDEDILEKTYQPICKYMDLLHWMEIEPGIIDFGLGDWCAPDRASNGPKCPSMITDTGYYFYDLMIVTRIASLLGYSREASLWAQKAEEVRKAFVMHFVDIETGLMVSDSQTAYACAIYQGLVKGELAQRVGANLVKQVKNTDYHLDTGILGTKFLFSALSMIGETEIAYRIAMNPTYPGWAYEVFQGANTIWEHWDGQKSHMHHMFSDIDSWFYRWIAGISPDPEEPGFSHIIFHPTFIRDLRNLRCEHESPYGTVAINWEYKGTTVDVNLKIPPSCHGTLMLPENLQSELHNGRILELASGIHDFCLFMLEDTQN